MPMQKLFFTFLILGFSYLSFAQTKSYPSSSGEMIFSFAKINKEGNDVSSNLRWSPVFNWQIYSNHDFSQHVGSFYGLAMRNVGFIYEVPNSDTLKKFRTYNIGIPLGIKVGNLAKGFFLYGGYEFEMPFHYKEKTFVNEDKKDKIAVWFSNRTEWYTQSVFAGINFPRGVNLKFKYYLNNFFNQNYTETNALGVRVKPFENFNANVFYIALQFNPFKDMRGYYKNRNKSKPKKQEERYSINY
jgi:hypothetical protein